MNIYNKVVQPSRTPMILSRWHEPARDALALMATLAELEGAGLLIDWLREAVMEPAPGPTGPFDLLFALLSVAGAGGTYVLYVRLIERRPAREISLNGAPGELWLGVLLGTGLIALCVGVLWAAGAYRVTEISMSAMVLSTLGGAIFAGFVEELLIRGIVFRLVEEVLGTWLAHLLSAVLFGVMHARNPGASAWSTTAIALEAGVLLGAAFVLTRRLWLAVGLHSAWNFVQGGVFGLPVSGNPSIGLSSSHLDGPPLLTGGSFGLEASPLAILTCLLAAALLLIRAHQRGRIVKMQWCADERTAIRAG